MSIDITFPELDFPFTIKLAEGVDTVTRQDAVFYYRTHDEVAVITAAGRTFTVNVCGETRAHVWPTDADCANQNPNSVTVVCGDEWAGVGIRTDVDLSEADDRIVWDYNSWFEVDEADGRGALFSDAYNSIEEAITGLRDYFAEQGTIHVHTNGVVELDPADSRATVCGACGRAWDDSVSTAWTPTPAGRCPFEYEHNDEPVDGPVCDECGENVPECANPEHDPHGRCADCCDDCRDARRVGPGFVIPLGDDEEYENEVANEAAAQDDA